MNGTFFSVRALRAAFLHWIVPILITTAGLAVVNLIWLIPTLGNIRASASLLALEIAHRVQGVIDADLGTTLREAQHAADEIAAEPDRTPLILDRLLHEHPDMDHVARVDRNGEEIQFRDRSSDSGTAMDMGMGMASDMMMQGGRASHGKHPHFYIALQGIANFEEGVFSSERGPSMMLAVPIRRNGRVEEALTANLSLDPFIRAVREIPAAQGRMYIVDRDGLEIVHLDASEMHQRQNVMARPIVQKIVVDGKVADGLAVEDEYVNEQGEQTFAVGLPIPIAGMGLVLEQSRSRAFAGERQMLLFAGVAMAVGLLMLTIILRSNVRLTRLNAFMRELLRDVENAGKMLVRRDLELTRANARLEELDEIKSEFVTIAAHQLRTPLTGIRWSYQILLEDATGVLTSGQRRILSGGLGASLRMINLVNDLLSVARIEEGRFGFHFTVQSPTGLIAHAADRFRKMAGDKGITFIATIPSGPISAFAFDEEKIALVLDNVLDNAVKYTEPGGKITLFVAEEKSVLKIVVSDTGIGVPEEQLHRVFGKFFRANNAVRFHTSGTGLGLYVSKNIVEKHNGGIHAESTEGKGSTFTITLPMAAEIKE